MSNSRVPEMMVRWNAAEMLFNNIIKQAGEKKDWETAVRKIDQLIAAITLRGDNLADTSEEFINKVWDDYEIRLNEYCQRHEGLRWMIEKNKKDKSK